MSGRTRTASIDELLQYEEELAPAKDRASDSGWIWLGRTALAAAGISVLVVFGARLVEIGLPFPVVFAVTLALMVLRKVALDVAPVPFVRSQPPPLRDDDWQLNWQSPDGAFAAASRWETRLSWTEADPPRFARNVQPLIIDLADERLRQKHGITRAGDPVRARELLGDPLWTFMTTPVTRSLTPRQIAALVAQVEAL